jgi:tetratricopeptide (TPR) repeat protein
MGALILVFFASLHGDLDDQIAEATRRIERSPRDAALWFRRGELHRFHEDWPAALADLRRAAELDPSMQGVDLALGKTWLLAGDAAKAREALDRFLAKQPGHAEARVDRGRALAALGLKAEAEAEFTRAIELLAEPRPEHYLERARVQEAERAAAGLEEGLRRLGSVVTLELALLDLELEARRFDAALARIDRLSAAAPRKESWLVRKADVLREAGRPAEAREAFAAALAAIESLPAGRRAARATAELEKRVREALREGR